VFHDSTLKEFATVLPASPEEMLAISGVGQTKLKKYGELFLETIRKYREEASGTV
jgi:ATP-dependent DNA helicase RecQ